MEGGPPCFPQGFTCPVVLWIPTISPMFYLQGSYLLWPTFPGSLATSKKLLLVLNPQLDIRPSTFDLRLFFERRLSKVQCRVGFGHLPGSLAATSGISIDYFSSGYLDVSVPPVPLPCGILEHDLKWVAPFGNLRINACLRLPEAYRSFLRPSSALSA